MNWLVGTFRTLTTNACPSSSPAVAVMATILTRKVLVLKAVQQLSVGLSIDCLSLALEIFCRLVKDTCQLPVDIGTCQDFVMNWYFDTASKRCHQFNYGGCGGNENRFQTEAECEGRCHHDLMKIELMNDDLLKHREKLRDLKWADKRKSACCLINREAAANTTQDSTTTEATESASDSHTAAVMETKITSRLLKNAKSFVTMQLACAN
jgi:hypothetical protein